MKLYFSTGSCSLAPDIALHETGAAFERERVDLQTKITETGMDYRTVNPKGSVPALRLDDGQVLTEVAAVLQYIGDQFPSSRLVPAAGTVERYRLMEWLSFVGTELHKSFSPFFRKAPEAWLDATRAALGVRFDFMSQKLGNQHHLMGDTFTVADCYAFAVLRWTSMDMIKFDMSKWPTLVEYQKRIAARPGVHAAMVAQGIIKA